MMIIWSGWGFLTVLIAVAGVLLGSSADMVVAATGLPRLGGLVGLLIVAGTAAANWYLGKRLNDAPGRTLIDPQTGQAVRLRRTHSLFFIPMQWWSLLIALFALLPLTVLVTGERPGGAHRGAAPAVATAPR